MIWWKRGREIGRQYGQSANGSISYCLLPLPHFHPCLCQHFINAFVDSKATHVHGGCEASSDEGGIVPVVFPDPSVEEDFSGGEGVGNVEGEVGTVAGFMAWDSWVEEVGGFDVELDGCAQGLESGDRG
jgi:hypothetical protein